MGGCRAADHHGGRVFKQVLVDSGTGKIIISFASQWNMPPLLFAWLTTALLRVAIGSATLAGITAAGILSPLLATGNLSPSCWSWRLVPAACLDSHVNDSGFWIFKEFFNLPQTNLSVLVGDGNQYFRTGLIGGDDSPVFS